MKKALLFAPLLALSACGYSVLDAVDDIKEGSSFGLSDGKRITATPTTTGKFTGIMAVGADDVNFVTGESYRISASGSADALAKLRYKIEDGDIIIGREKGNWKGNKDKAVITITAPSIASISNAGSSAITADAVSGGNVEFSLAGSGSIDVASIKAQRSETNVAGSGSVKLAGTAANAEYSMAGSGNIDASALNSSNAEVSIAGAGDVSLNASKNVEASMLGSGNVRVTGGAKCESSKLGSGKLDCS